VVRLCRQAIGPSRQRPSLNVLFARSTLLELSPRVDNTEKLEFMRSVGADHVIDYTREDFTRNGRTYDLIFDLAALSTPSMLAHKRSAQIGIFSASSSSRRYELVFAPIRQGRSAGLSSDHAQQLGLVSAGCAGIRLSGTWLPAIGRSSGLPASDPWRSRAFRSRLATRFRHRVRPPARAGHPAAG
jgi:hypothetical protein